MDRKGRKKVSSDDEVDLDSLDGEGLYNAGGSENSDEDDSVDKEELPNTPVTRGDKRTSENVETSSGNRRSSRRHSYWDNESDSSDDDEDESSVDLEEREDLYRGEEVEAPHQMHERGRRSTLAEDALRVVRGKVRVSLDAASSAREWFGLTKEHILRQKVPIIWKPIWNARNTGRLFLVLAIFTLPLALYLFFAQLSAQEYKFTFGEECKTSRNYLRLIRSMCVFCGGNLNPHCSKLIVIPEDMRTPVFLYYELEGIHQNHRLIAKAYDNNQLVGNIFTADGEPREPSENCGQYSRDKDGKIYFPCGQLANIMYTDEFALLTDKGYEVPLRFHGIAMSALKQYRFRNPPVISSQDYHLKQQFKKHFVKPIDWTTEIWDKWWKDGGMENERFINWMNPSALANFRKLYAVIDAVPDCRPGFMCKGNYTMQIEYRYDIEKFNANKAFVLATVSHLGGQNYYLPLLVGIVGCVQLLFGLMFVQVDRLLKDIEKEMDELERYYYMQYYKRLSRVQDGDAESVIRRVETNTQILNTLASHSVSEVVTIPVTNDEPFPGPSSSAKTAPPPEDMRGKRAGDLFTLYKNPVSRTKSAEVYPDYYYNDLGWSDLSTDYYTTVDEEEEDDGDNQGFSSAESVLAAEVSPARTNLARDASTYDLRKRHM